MLLFSRIFLAIPYSLWEPVISSQLAYPIRAFHLALYYFFPAVWTFLIKHFKWSVKEKFPFLNQLNRCKCVPFKSEEREARFVRLPFFFFFPPSLRSGSGYLHLFVYCGLIISETPTCATVSACLNKYFHIILSYFSFLPPLGCKLYFLRISSQKFVVIRGGPKYSLRDPIKLVFPTVWLKNGFRWNLIVPLCLSKADQVIQETQVRNHP